MSEKLIQRHQAREHLARLFHRDVSVEVLLVRLLEFSEALISNLHSTFVLWVHSSVKRLLRLPGERGLFFFRSRLNTFLSCSVPSTFSLVLLIAIRSHAAASLCRPGNVPGWQPKSRGHYQPLHDTAAVGQAKAQRDSTSTRALILLQRLGCASSESSTGELIERFLSNIVWRPGMTYHVDVSTL